MTFHPVRLSKPAQAFVHFIADRPLTAIFLGLAFIIALAPGMGRLTADFTYRAFFLPDDPALIEYDKFERRFGNDDAAVIGIHSPSGIFDAESMEIVRALTDKLWQVTDIIRVDSLTNFNWVHAEGDDILVEPLIPADVELTDELLAHRKAVALAHEVLPDYMISRDGKTTMLFAVLKPGFEHAPDDSRIAGEIDKLIEEFSVGDHRFFHSGNPAMGRAFRDAAIVDMETLIPIVLILTVVMIYLMLRSFTGIFLSLTVVVLSIVGTLGTAGLIGIKMTNVTTMLPQILIAIGIADSVHVLASFYLALRNGTPRREAAIYALTKNFQATIMTTVTTAGGFFSFMTATLQPLKDIGMLGGIGAIVAWIVTYLVLGGMMFLLPLKPGDGATANHRQRQRLAARLSGWIEGNTKPIVAIFALFAIGSAFLSTRLDVNSDPFKYFAADYPIRVANDFLEANIGAARGIELVIDAGSEEGIKNPAFLKKVETLQAELDKMPGVTRTLSIVDILKQTNRSLHGDDPNEYRLVDDADTIAQELFLYTMSLPQGMDINDRVTLKNDAVRLTVLWTITSSSEAVLQAEAAVAKAHALGLDAVYTGKTMLWQGMNGKVVFSFLSSIGLALALITTMLIVYFRSFGIGIIALIPNVVPLFFGGAILWLLGKTLDVGTVMAYSVCLGIAVDDTIHVLANYYRLTKQEGKSPRDAIEELLNYTGGALLATTAILVCAFGTFMFATFQPNLYFGVLTAGILSIALVTTLTYLPASLLLADRKDADR